MNRMIGRLPADFDDLHEPVEVPRRALNRADETRRFEMIRTRARHEHTVALEDLHGELIESLVRRLAFRNVFLALDERGWIDDHDIEAPPVRVQLFEHVECVALDR